jgi:GTP-binding protein
VEFSALGFGDFLCISATNNLNKSVLIERIFENVEHIKGEKPAEQEIKIALLGKRNAGKSTLLNAAVKSERVITSEIPGTTRDSVDVRFETNGKNFTVIDTAGLRKKSKIADSIEFYGYVRAKRAISRADIIFFLIDSMLPISQVDKKLSQMITAEYKPCVVVINKWDLAKNKASGEDFADYLTTQLPGIRNSPIAFTTATEGKNVQSLLDLAVEVHKQATKKIPTPQLNKAFEIIKQTDPSGKKGSKIRPKIYYGTQVAVNPVTILMFVNNPQIFEKNYLKNLKSQLKTLLDIEEVPLRLLLRSHRK